MPTIYSTDEMEWRDYLQGETHERGLSVPCTFHPGQCGWMYVHSLQYYECRLWK